MAYSAFALCRNATYMCVEIEILTVFLKFPPKPMGYSRQYCSEKNK